MFIFLILVSGIFYYNLTGNVVIEKQEVFVFRVIDGDTIQDRNGQSYRFLGINTPEKNQLGYQEAKDFLKQYENKTIEIENHGYDKYERFLVYAFYGNQFVNQEVLVRGLASLFYYDKDEYYAEMKNAEETARNKEIGIWKKSPNYGCIKILKFEPIDKTEKDNETLVLDNLCGINLGITIKDDATHIYNEEISGESTLKMNFKNIFNDDGDSLYIYDSKGLILFYRY